MQDLRRIRMANRWLVLASTLVLAAACAGGTATPTPGAGTPTPGAATPTPTAGPVTGSATLGAWESSPSERSALSSAVAAFSVTHPALTVTQETVAGDYRAQMITRCGAHNPPDLFYVNAEYARDWADNGFLQPLDDYLARSGF